MNLKKAFSIIYAFIACWTIPNSVFAQAINQHFFGQNAWYSDYSATGSGDTPLYTHWGDIDESGVHYVRVGGNNFNLLNTPNITKIVDLIDQIRANGMEPIMSVSFPNPGNDNSNLNVNAATAASLVYDINNVSSPYYRYVEKWVIANEPDQCSNVSPNFCSSGHQQGYSYDGTHGNDIQYIADYIKKFSIEMKKIDNTIKIIGPEISYYIDNIYDALFVNGVGSGNDISGLIPATYQSVSTGAAYNKPFVDYLSVHIYPNDFSTGSTSTNRTTAIAQLQTAETTSGSLRWQLKQLKDKVTAINASTQRSSTPIKLVVTETNVAYENEASNTQPAITLGNDNRSFLGGQWWAEWMSVLMQYNVDWVNFWSAVENPFGYIDASGNKRSAYWHFKMMAENFKGTNTTFLPNGYSNSTNYKAFAYKNTTANEIGVIILNQDIQTTPSRGTDYNTKSFKINFNNGTPSGMYDMKFSFNGSASAIADYPCTIMKETTMLLVFDTNTGALKKRESYSLQDALRTVDTGTYTNITNDSPSYLYNNFTNPTPVHSNIVIGTGNTITAGVNQNFKATNSIQLNGPYNSNNYTLELSIDHTCP